MVASLPLPDEPGTHVVLGAILMFVASGCFICLDSMLKYLAAENNILILAWLRYVLQAAFVAALLPAIGVSRLVATRNYKLHALRGLLIALSTIFILLGLKHLPMDETYAIGFSTPSIATALAMPILGERASREQWLWIVVGFAGVLIIVGPKPAASGLAILFPLAMAASNAGYQVLTRLTGRHEGPLTLLFHMALWGAFWMSLTLPWSWEALPATTLLWMLAGGAFGTVAQLLLIQALRIAPMAIVSPMGYSLILWATAAGYFVFGEVPGPWALIGIVAVVASGIFLIRAREPDGFEGAATRV